MDEDQVVPKVSRETVVKTAHKDLSVNEDLLEHRVALVSLDPKDPLVHQERMVCQDIPEAVVKLVSKEKLVHPVPLVLLVHKVQLVKTDHLENEVTPALLVLLVRLVSLVPLVVRVLRVTEVQLVFLARSDLQEPKVSPETEECKDLLVPLV